MASDYWNWHPTAGKPWMQERMVPQADAQPTAEEDNVLPPADAPDRPRVLLRLYSTVDPESGTESMDAREYALFCTDYADAMKDFAANCRMKRQRGEKYRQLGKRVPTQEDCGAADLLSDQAEARRAAAEAYVASPESAPPGSLPTVDALRTEFAVNPPSCPTRLDLLLHYAGQDVTRQRKLESLAGAPESPWRLCWSSEHRLWFWHEPVRVDGVNGSTWLRPVSMTVLRRVLRAKMKLLPSEGVTKDTNISNAIGKIKSSRDLLAYIADPTQLLRNLQERVAPEYQVHEVASETERQPADSSSAAKQSSFDIAAVSVVLGYDYRLRANEPPEYVSGAEERPLSSPAGLALDRDRNRLFVSEKHRIRALLLDGTAPADVIAGYQGADSGGQVVGFVDGEGGKARFNSPGALAFETVSKVLYVADTGNHAIRAVQETDTGWHVTTVVGTGAPGGFGGPALEYSGRLRLQLNDMVDKAKEIAMLTVGKKSELPPQERALLSKVRSTGFKREGLTGGADGTLEWRASMQPLVKPESLPKMDGKPMMLPAQVRGSIEATHDGMPRERMVVRSAPPSPPGVHRVQDIAPLTSEEVEKSTDVCIEMRGAKGLAGSTVDGEERGFAAVITWGPGASTLSGEDGSGSGADGLRLLRQRMLHLQPGEYGHIVGKGCRRWCTALAAGPDPVWNEFVHVRVPQDEDIEVVVDVWSAASLCAPQAIALSPAVGNYGLSPSRPSEMLIGCGDTREPGAPEAQAEVDTCDSALAVLNDEDARLTRSLGSGALTDEERAQLESRQAQLRTEQQGLVERRRTALARSTAAHSIRSLQLPVGTRVGVNCIMRSLVRGGAGIVDPCAIVIQPHPFQRRYVVMEGCTRRLVQLQPNGDFRPLAKVSENSSAVCCSPSGASLYTVDTCTAKRNDGLEELGRLRQAKFQWQWGDEKYSPPRVEWHNFDEEDRSVIEELHREYLSGRVGNAHIAQFSMPKDRVADLSAINCLRDAVSYLKRLNQIQKAQPVPTEPIIHLLRNYGAVKPSKRGRLLDFETMRAAIDSTLRRPITQYTRVGPRTTTSDVVQFTGMPMGDPIKGKVGGFFSEWVRVHWEDVERDKKIVALIVEDRGKHGQNVDSTEDLEALSSSALRVVASRVKNPALRRQLQELYSASLENTPGAERARQDLMRRKAKAAAPGDFLLRSPWLETSSLKVMMVPKDEVRRNQAASVAWSTSDGVSASVLPKAEPAPHSRLPRVGISEVRTPVERWLFRHVNAGAIPWLKPLADSPMAFREFSRSLQPKIFQPGTNIITAKRGPVDQMPMYILTAGKAIATGKLDHTPHKYPPEQTVMEYNTLGQTFGELAMLSETHYVRAATVKVVEKCTVLVVTRALFMRFVQANAVCMKLIRERTPAEYWGEYRNLKKPSKLQDSTGGGAQQEQVCMPGSRPRVMLATHTQQARAQKVKTRHAKVKPKATTRMWTTGPGGGGPVTALPADLNWRELRRSDGCTMEIVPGGDELPLRDPRAILSLDEHTLLVADRWIDWTDEKTPFETGAIWRINLDMLKVADDLKSAADNCFRTKSYRRALEGYQTSAAIFRRNKVLEKSLLKTTKLCEIHGDEPGSGPSASNNSKEEEQRGRNGD